MKNLIKKLFCLVLSMTLLSSCGTTTTFEKDSFDNINIEFNIGKDGNTSILCTPKVNDVIDISKEEFVSRYMDNHLEDRYEYYTYQGMSDSDGVEFVFTHEFIRNYVNKTFEGKNINKNGPNKIYIYIDYLPTEYTIQYVGFEDQDLSPKTYTIKTGGVDLPKLNTEGEYRRFAGWRIQGTDTIITKTPTDNLANLVLEPTYVNDEFVISYNLPVDEDNPNPTSYTYYDEAITLIDFSDDPNGAYKFDGFYLNGKKITSIDPHLAKDIEIECRFIFTEYNAKFYVDDELYETITFTYVTLYSIIPPAVPNKDHYKPGVWDTYITECKNYEIHAVYEKIVYTITYEYPFGGISNPNITSFTAFDGVVNLTPLANSNKGYYTFDGFYLNGSKITSLDTSIGQNITLVAKYNFTDYTINYYDGDTLLYSDTVNYLTFNDYVQRDVPNKDHYYDGKWSTTITELKNYNIYASYTVEQYKVSVVTGIDGYKINDITVTYGEGVKYQDIADLLSYQDKYFIGLYSDSSFSTLINLDSLIEKNITLYVKWGDIIHLTTASDWDKIVQDPAGYYILSNDISFKMEEIPVINNFTGILDGNGYKIQRFSNSNTSCDANYGIFKTNSGTIKNLIIEDGTFVANNASGSDTCYLGVLSGTNKGTIINVDFKSITANITANIDITINSFQDINTYAHVGLYAGNNQGTIENCYIKEDCQLTAKAIMAYYRTVGVSGSEFLMYGYFYYGLLAGLNSGTISHITSRGTILVNSISIKEERKSWSYALMSGVRYLTRSGGIVGNNQNKGLITLCEGEATITVDYNNPTYETSFAGENRIGGIVGNNSGTVEKCYTSDASILTNNKNGDLDMGGIIGHQEADGKLRACYSICKFISSNSNGLIRIGGLIGYNSGSISYSYAIVTDVTVIDSTKRSGGVGALVGYTTDTSSITFSVGEINIENEITIVDCYEVGNTTNNAILNKISIYAPTQTNEIKSNNITSVDSLEALIEATSDYYFDEVDFVLCKDKMPIIEGIGKI